MIKTLSDFDPNTNITGHRTSVGAIYQYLRMESATVARKPILTEKRVLV